MTHVLIVGVRGIGKSTLIQRVLKELGKPVFGFETKKEDALADEKSGSPVYIYDPALPRHRSSENLLGYCLDHHFNTIKGVFDRYASKLFAPVPKGHIVLLDELGFMESEEKVFCKAVLSLLDGDAPVIAAVKDKNFPFLEQVRSHPKCRCFFITEENRDSLYVQVLDFMKMQIEEAAKHQEKKLRTLEHVNSTADLEYFISLQDSEPTDNPEHSARKWDKRAEVWNKERMNNRKSDERVDDTIHFLEQRGLLKAEYDFADVGCGPGRFAAAFAKRVHSVVGFDLSEKMVQYGMEHIKQEGLKNVQLRICDFQAMDVVKEGYKGAFDLVFSSMTPAIQGMDGLMRSMKMSRAYCCNITRVYDHSFLQDQIMAEVFGKEPPAHWGGRSFYSLFNILFLMGYYPETSYEDRHQEVQIQPDGEYVEFVMEQMLPKEEHTKENAEKIFSWIQKHVDEKGLLTDKIDACYGRILWDVRKKREEKQK